MKEENQNAREEENRKPENQEQENNAQESKNQQIKEMGQAVLNGNSRNHKVELLTIIGEVEGHESAPSHSKTTKYEHILPKLAIIEDDEEIEGLLILLNTVGGDVEAGLAIAEAQVAMIPQTYVELTDEQALKDLQRTLDLLDDDDDVTDYWTNWDEQ